MDDVMEEMKVRRKQLQIDGRNMEAIEMAECTFTDDLVIHEGMNKDSNNFERKGMEGGSG